MKAYLSIGSNIQPAKNISACLKKIKEIFILRKTSSIYRTSPVGPVGKRMFLNLAVEIETPLSRSRLLRILRRLERILGRARGKNKFSPRPIDVDLVLYGNWRRVGFQKLAFVLFPLVEIAPRLRPAGLKQPLRRLAREFRDPEQKIRKIKQAAIG